MTFKDPSFLIFKLTQSSLIRRNFISIYIIFEFIILLYLIFFIKNMDNLFLKELDIPDNKETSNYERIIGFLFDQSLIDQTKNKEFKSNRLDIYEEFNIYNKVYKKRDINILIDSALDSFVNKHSIFSFFLNILLGSLNTGYNIYNIEYNIDNILLQIKEKRDLTKISGKDLIN